MTDAERRLWSRLRERQLATWRFRRQHPVPPYVADFACLEAKLIVEVDGGQHAGSAIDKQRDRRLRSLGWRVLRFWNNDVLANEDGVIETILAALGPHPDLPPAKPGEGA
jgi:primosomal protein N' (replication factor Y)